MFALLGSNLRHHFSGICDSGRAVVGRSDQQTTFPVACQHHGRLRIGARFCYSVKEIETFQQTLEVGQSRCNRQAHPMKGVVSLGNWYIEHRQGAHEPHR